VRIQHPLLKLPIRFCADTLAREVSSLPPSAWRPHPQKFDGNIAVPLVSPGGRVTDEWSGAMGPTEALKNCGYIREIMAELNSTWGRSRLMGLEPGSVVPEHVDVHYYWRTHLRIHVPVITNPQVGFTCGEETVHLAAGECWLLDSFFRHSVDNRGDALRIHLVLDTVGSARLWDLIDGAASGTAEEKFVAPGTAPARALQFEQINAPAIMSPWEMKSHIGYITSWTNEEPRLEPIARILDRFLMTWGGTWSRYGTSDEGLPHYMRHLAEVRGALDKIGGPPLLMRNGWPMLDSLHRYVLANAILPAKLKQLQAAAAGRAPQYRMSA
jgi:hypothetical protein